MALFCPKTKLPPMPVFDVPSPWQTVYVTGTRGPAPPITQDDPPDYTHQRMVGRIRAEEDFWNLFHLLSNRGSARSPKD
jgi:hypothetical protein